MSSIHLNCLIRFSHGASGTGGIFRIIHANLSIDRLWAIRVSNLDGSSVSYYRRPYDFSILAVESMLSEALAEFVADETPKLWLMSDGQIEARYGKRGDDGQCVQLVRRDRDWHVIEGLVKNYTFHELLERGLYRSVIHQRALEVGCRPKSVASALHRYWAGSCNKNALLAKFDRCGGAGKIRKQEKKLGRPNVFVRQHMIDRAGYCLCDDDRSQLAFGWENYVRPGVTVQSAYLRTMEVFYRQPEVSPSAGVAPLLKEPHDRPTIRQFRYWGSRGDRERSAVRLQMDQGDFERAHRALHGTARDGVDCVGQLAYCDATTNDVHLMSAISRTKVVGTAHRIVIVDTVTGLIAGLNCGFDAPSAQTALSAVANAALDKVDFCARFGIDIVSEEWPAIAFLRYLSDNGELRNQQSIDSIPGIGGTLEFVPVFRPEQKSIVESIHHVLHKKLDHKLPGTTRGQLRKRGQRHPALSACLTYFEYMRLLIRRILHYNNEERVTQLLTTEMRRDGVVPTRLNIYRWCQQNGYGAAVPPSADMVRAHLLPVLPAVLTGRGIFLLRTDRGAKAEHIKGARFVGSVLKDRGMMELARRNHTRVEVRGDPQDLRRVWLVMDGVHELLNVATDPLAAREWTLKDHLSVQDEDLLDSNLDIGRRTQREVELDTGMFAEVGEAQLAKRAEMERQESRVSMHIQIADMRANRRAERKLSTGLPAMKSQVTDVPPLYVSGSSLLPPADGEEDLLSVAHEALRRFNKTRSSP